MSSAPVSTFAYDASYRGVYSAERPDLGGNVDQGDPYSYAPSVWDYVVGRFAIRSVLDVGAGQGHAAAWFARYNLAVIAIDGLAANLERAVYPLVIHDLRAGPFLTRVDLVHCAEVAEHLEPEYVDNLVGTLACGRVVLLTHALPGQGGYHHVNCQPADYWIDKMAHAGYTKSTIDTSQIRALAERDHAQHFLSGLVFTRTA